MTLVKVSIKSANMMAGDINKQSVANAQLKAAYVTGLL